jgi:RimJ/RimL family protein N-acetyltransferase
MYFEHKTITLKDRRSCLLRSPQLEDAEEMLAYLHQAAAETHFLLREPEDVSDTLESEQLFIQQILTSESQLMIVAVVDGKLAGNCGLTFKTYSKVKHRCDIGIGLLKEFWGLGIGNALFAEMFAAAKAHGASQMELAVIEGNLRGMALYKKMGFEVVGAVPNAIRLSDGSFLKEYVMVKEL